MFFIELHKIGTIDIPISGVLSNVVLGLKCRNKVETLLKYFQKSRIV
jgi:hypothetical protein